LAELRSLLQKDEPVRLYAVSIDSPEETKEFENKIAADGRGAIGFPLLSDPDHRVIDGYGLRDPAYTAQKFDGVPYPTVYVIDKDGRVAWAKVSQDYRQRASNPEIRAALDSLR
jgi:peroxiredoxin